MTEQTHRRTTKLLNTAAAMAPAQAFTYKPEGPVRLLTITEVIGRVGLQKSWLYGAIKAGHFPAPLDTINARRALWSSHDIERWLSEKTAASAPKTTIVTSSTYRGGAK